MNSKTRKILIATGAVLALVALLVTGQVVAKYIKQDLNRKEPVSAKAFYFESNYLTADCRKYNLNAGTQSVEIELYNFENELRISEVDCTYEVKVEKTDDVNYKSDITVDPTTAEKQGTSKFTLSNLQDGCTYTVTVTANGGYEKTLSAKFTVAAKTDKCYMNLSETAEYVLLTVWTEDVTGKVSVTFPAGLIPDATDSVLKNVNNYNSETQTYESKSFEDSISNYASRSYRFFKTKDYNAESNSFTVKVGEKDAQSANIP